jgi:hypothetical protein
VRNQPIDSTRNCISLEVMREQHNTVFSFDQFHNLCDSEYEMKMEHHENAITSLRFHTKQIL